MKIRNIKATFNVKKITDFDKLALEIRRVGDYYFKFPLKKVNIPDDAPDEIARLIGDAKVGFNLVVTGNSVIIDYKNIPATMDDSFILDTLSTIISNIGSMLENYIDSPYNFVGITTQVVVSKEELGEEPLNYMINKMHGFTTEDVIDHLDYRATFIEVPYYINLAICNESKITVNAPSKYDKPTMVSKEDEHLLMTIDINDKYGFLYMNDYSSEIENAEKLIDSFICLYSEKLLPFIKEGKIAKFMR